MANGQVSAHKQYLTRYKRDFKTVTVTLGDYNRLTAKAEEFTCPRTYILEALIDNYLDKITEEMINYKSSDRRRVQ